MGVSPDIAAAAAKLGIDPSLLVGGGSSSDDPAIYMGSSHPSAGFDTELGAHGAKQQHAVPVTKPYSQYVSDFYGLSKEALTQFQTRAYQAGLYGNQTPRYGDFNDDVAFGIWQDVGKRAAGFNAAGQKFTPGDVLDMAVQSTPGVQRQQRAYETRTDVVQTDDPNAVRAAAHAAFKAVTGKGRKVDDAKVQKFLDTFTAQQIGAQRTVNRAQDKAAMDARARQDTADAGGNPGQSPVSQEVQVSTPDLGASAEAFARASDPSGAGAHDVSKQFDTLLRMLQGVV